MPNTWTRSDKAFAAKNFFKNPVQNENTTKAKR